MNDTALQVWIETDDLAAVFAGGPVIILDATLPDCLPLYGLGARVLRLHAVPEGLLLRPMGGSAAPAAHRGAPRLLRQAPGDVLAAVTREQPTARRLIGWWQAVAGDGAVPPVVVAESGLAALPVLLRHALTEVAGLSARCAELELALAALREAGEDTRTALHEVNRTLGHRPPAPLLLALGRPAATGDPLALPAPDVLRLDLPLPVQGVAALALHLADPSAGPSAGAAAVSLRVRLIGAESGRVAGAWTVPGSALLPGWLRLDLPAPATAGAEDAVLELAADGAGADGTLLLSPAEPDAADGAAPGPALMVWTSQAGGRFHMARHFDWAAWEGEAPPPGTPLLPPADLFAAARLAGPVQLVPHRGADASRAMLRLAPGWREATILLPGLALQPGDAVRLDLRARAGDLRGATAALALLPPDEGATLAVLQASALARAGWRTLSPEGGASTLAVAAPADLRSVPTLALSLRNELPDREREAEIELMGIRLLRPAGSEGAGGEGAARLPAGAPSPLIAPPLAMAEYPLALAAGAYPFPGAVAAGLPRPAPLAGPAPAAPANGGAVFDSAQLDNHMAGDGYELIDLQVRNLSAADLTWPRLKFKLSVSGETVTLELRGGPDFPEMFEEWPGGAADDYGPVHHVVAAPGGLFGHDRFRTPRDRALVSGLLAILPEAVAGALAGARRPGVDGEAWADAARAFVQRMRAG